jgi:hypothetical protein
LDDSLRKEVAKGARIHKGCSTGDEDPPEKLKCMIRGNNNYQSHTRIGYELKSNLKTQITRSNATSKIYQRR